MSKRRKVILVVACIMGAFLLTCLVIAPRLLQVDRYRPYVISLIEQETGRHVEIGKLGLSLFPTVSIRVDNLAISNPRGFPAANWLMVKQVHARLDARALWHHQIIIRSLELSQPVLSLLSDAHGHWNYQLPASRQVATNTPQPGVPAGGMPENSSDDPHAGLGAGDPPLFTLQEISGVSLKDGSFLIANLAPNGEPGPPAVEGEGISTNLKNINLAAFANPRSAAASLANATGKLSLKTLHAANFELQNITSLVQATPAQVRLDNLKFDFYGGRGEANVLLDLASSAPQYNAQGELSGVDAEKLLAAFPQARGQLTGTLETQFTFSGESTASPDPWAGKQGRGTMTVHKGRLPKLQLDKALLNLARVAQMGPVSGDPAAFSVISLNWRLARDVVTTRNVHMAGNGIVLDGSGNVDLTGPGRLNYQGMAEITAQRNSFTNILADLSGARFSNGKLGMPFTLVGTLQRPQFKFDTSGMLNRALGTPAKNNNQAPQNLFNLFKLKK